MCDTNEKLLKIIDERVRELNKRQSDQKLQDILDQLDEYLKKNSAPTEVHSSGWKCPVCGNIINPWYSYCPICYNGWTAEPYRYTPFPWGEVYSGRGDFTDDMEITICYHGD
jgi:hypothetical protein